LLAALRERPTAAAACSCVSLISLTRRCSPSFFQRIEILADVLDQRHDRGGFVGHLLHQHRYFVQASQPGGAHATLAGDDLVVGARAGKRPHQHRLHHALGLDALRQLVQRTFVHARARLVAPRMQLRQPQRGRRRSHGRIVDLRAEQRLQPEPQALRFLCHHARLSGIDAAHTVCCKATKWRCQ
jgi:hypothetical protein